MKRIVFLVSGKGSNLKFIQHALKYFKANAEIVGVLSDREIKFHHFLDNEHLHYVQIKYNKTNNVELLAELRKLDPDVIITNIHKIIDEEVLNEFGNRFLNLHYSLLPSFSGLIGMKTVEEAKNQNVQFVGGTCHEVNKEVDAGKILYQGLFVVGDWGSKNLDVIKDTVFKLSCLLLLSGIFKKLDSNFGHLKQIIINGYPVCFSPELPIESSEFAFEIFKKLK